MSSSEMLSRYLTSARMLLPCAAITTRLPPLMAGAIDSFQNGSTRATVSFRHSVSGTCSRRAAWRSAVAALAARVVRGSSAGGGVS